MMIPTTTMGAERFNSGTMNERERANGKCHDGFVCLHEQF
jgi:hypothetical protein